MDYQKHYDNLMKTRKDKCSFGNLEYWEKHHIIPQCLGGNNKKENIVLLTPREHYIAHWLLWKATKSHKLAFAFAGLSYQHKSKRNFSAKEYERARQIYKTVASLIYKGRALTDEHRRKLSIAAQNRAPDSEETRRNKSLARKGKTLSEEHKKSIGLSQLGKKHSEETKLKMSQSAKGKSKSDEHKKKLSESIRNRYKGQEHETT